MSFVILRTSLYRGLLYRSSTVCLLQRGFVVSRFFFIYLTITGMKNIIRYTKDFVIQRFVISRFHCHIFCFERCNSFFSHCNGYLCAHVKISCFCVKAHQAFHWFISATATKIEVFLTEIFGPEVNVRT